MQEEREPRLPKLFPDTNTPRAHRFPGKRVSLGHTETRDNYSLWWLFMTTLKAEADVESPPNVKRETLTLGPSVCLRVFAGVFSQQSSAPWGDSLVLCV